ncbi:MAG: phosphoglucomutase/phosphomannomutase family protein [Terriglobales bacterium]
MQFGTDGWRGVIADDFTFDNVRRVSAAIAAWILKNEDPRKGVAVGYDTRFASRRAAEIVAETVAAAGIPVRLATDYTPTPVASFAVRRHGCAGGVVVTASHNPWNWNGVKFKAAYGGSATPAIMKGIEAELRAGRVLRAPSAAVTDTDFKPAYLDAIARFVDLDRIARAKFRFAHDSMHGAGRGMLASLFQPRGIELIEVREEVNPLFPGINPEPIEPHVALLQEVVVRERCHAGFATDGDADRIGAVAEDGSFVDPHKIFSILLRWLLERKQWPGEVARTFSSTRMLDRIAARHGRRLHETAIGFKYICDLMLERDILIGGEESGGIGLTRHLPERDAILNALMLASVMADEGKTLAELVESVQQEFGRHYYGRRDLHIAEEAKQAAIGRARSGEMKRVGRYAVIRSQEVDGIKFFLDAPTNGQGADAWLLMRASGTEPLLRLYAEAASPELVDEILSEAEAIVRRS